AYGCKSFSANQWFGFQQQKKKRMDARPLTICTPRIYLRASPTRQFANDITPRKAQHKPHSILVIDVGGTHVKLLMTGQKDPVKIPSNLSMTAAKMVRAVKKATRAWKYDA